MLQSCDGAARSRPKDDDLAREGDVREGTSRLDVVQQHGLAVTGGLGKAHVARNGGLEDFFLEELANVVRDLL